MHLPIRNTIGIACLALLAAVAQAAPFVAPAEENPPFRRDLLPIDPDAMVTLSGQLSLLSQSAPLDTATGRRAAAQALALALALDPANSGARDTLSLIANGKPIPEPDGNKLTGAKARTWQMLGWLGTPEAGADGNLLADLVSDTAIILDPDHPTAVARRDLPERGKWDAWVAPVSAFEIAKAIPREDPKPGISETPSLPGGKPEIRLTSASVKTVLYAYSEKEDSHLLGNTVVRMEATKGSGKGLVIRVPGGSASEGRNISNFVVSPIRDSLGKIHGSLPAHGTISLLTGDKGGYLFSKNSGSLSGPGFVLANAALTGVEPYAAVIGVIDKGNKLISPDYFWDLVCVLREGDGGRIVVPASSEKFFTALVTMEQPEFFLKNEVLLASTPAELAALSAKTRDAAYSEASAKFKEIVDKSAGNPVGSYLANRYVRQRLLEIAAAAPYHLSAKLLATERPSLLPKEVLAAMIWRTMAPIRRIDSMESYKLGVPMIPELEKTYEEVRAELDKLDRYKGPSDGILLERAKSVANDVRSLSRALRSRGAYVVRISEINKARRKLKDSNKELKSELSEITGDPQPDEAAERMREMRNR